MAGSPWVGGREGVLLFARRLGVALCGLSTMEVEARVAFSVPVFLSETSSCSWTEIFFAGSSIFADLVGVVLCPVGFGGASSMRLASRQCSPVRGWGRLGSMASADLRSFCILHRSRVVGSALQGMLSIFHI